MIYSFEWDTNKAKTNFSKHNIRFEDAVSVFRDKNAISIYDEKNSAKEDRWVTIGMDFKTRTMVVIHTFVYVDSKSCNIRIISARRATKKEQREYKDSL
ncbi:MAG: BrnT family toxin [Campylobacterales bacterium]